MEVSSNLTKLELNHAHISGEAFQFIFSGKGLLNVYLLTRKWKNTKQASKTTPQTKKLQIQKHRAVC